MVSMFGKVASRLKFPSMLRRNTTTSKTTTTASTKDGPVESDHKSSAAATVTVVPKTVTVTSESVDLTNAAEKCSESVNVQTESLQVVSKETVVGSTCGTIGTKDSTNEGCYNSDHDNENGTSKNTTSEGNTSNSKTTSNLACNAEEVINMIINVNGVQVHSSNHTNSTKIIKDESAVTIDIDNDDDEQKEVSDEDLAKIVVANVIEKSVCKVVEVEKVIINFPSLTERPSFQLLNDKAEAILNHTADKAVTLHPIDIISEISQNLASSVRQVLKELEIEIQRREEVIESVCKRIEKEKELRSEGKIVKKTDEVVDSIKTKLVKSIYQDIINDDVDIDSYISSDEKKSNTTATNNQCIFSLPQHCQKDFVYQSLNKQQQSQKLWAQSLQTKMASLSCDEFSKRCEVFNVHDKFKQTLMGVEDIMAKSNIDLIGGSGSNVIGSNVIGSNVIGSYNVIGTSSNVIGSSNLNYQPQLDLLKVKIPGLDLEKNLPHPVVVPKVPTMIDQINRKKLTELELPQLNIKKNCYVASKPKTQTENEIDFDDFVPSTIGLDIAIIDNNLTLDDPIINDIIINSKDTTKGSNIIDELLQDQIIEDEEEMFSTLQDEEATEFFEKEILKLGSEELLLEYENLIHVHECAEEFEERIGLVSEEKDNDHVVGTIADGNALVDEFYFRYEHAFESEFDDIDHDASIEIDDTTLYIAKKSRSKSKLQQGGGQGQHAAAVAPVTVTGTAPMTLIQKANSENTPEDSDCEDTTEGLDKRHMEQLFLKELKMFSDLDNMWWEDYYNSYGWQYYEGGCDAEYFSDWNLVEQEAMAWCDWDSNQSQEIGIDDKNVDNHVDGKEEGEKDEKDSDEDKVEEFKSEEVVQVEESKVEVEVNEVDVEIVNEEEVSCSQNEDISWGVDHVKLLKQKYLEGEISYKEVGSKE